MCDSFDFPDPSPCITHLDTEAQHRAIQEAFAALEQRPPENRATLPVPTELRNYLQLMFAASANARFSFLILDADNRIVSSIALAREADGGGSIDKRDFALRALATQTAKAVWVHNRHSDNSSGRFVPCRLTQAAQQFFDAIDVKVLSHGIAGDFDRHVDSGAH